MHFKRPRVRWVIFAFLFAFGFLAYIQRISLAVAAERMMPELGLSQLQIGWLLTAFLIGYTAFQLPGGLLGERFGARSIFLAIGLLALFATLATALAPMVLYGAALLLVLFTARAILGVAQAPIFPVSSGVMESWFPQRQWAFVQGLQVAGLGLGSAVTPPLIANLMQLSGWKTALLLTSVPTLPLLALWTRYAKDLPQNHPGVSPAELQELDSAYAGGERRPGSLKEALSVLRNGNILLLTLAYLGMNVVFYLLSFWSFLYLVQERHFTVLESSWLATLPFLAAALGAATGGRISDLLTARFGLCWGYRAVPLAALPISGVLLFLSVRAESAPCAIAGLCGAFLTIELTEGAFFAAAMAVARTQTMAATGILNTGGNCGGIIATPLIAAMSGRQQWTAAFALGATFAIVAGFIWLFIDASQSLQVGCATELKGAVNVHSQGSART